MARLIAIAAIVSAATWAAPARADVSGARQHGLAAAPVAHAGVSGIAGDAAALGYAAPGPAAGETLPDGVGSGSVVSMPAAPSSAALFLTALGSIGAWHAGRSARKLNAGFTPDWYHTAGPAQVGHAIALDLDCCVLAPAVIESLAGFEPRARTLAFVERPIPIRQADGVRARSPRAPPPVA